MVGEGRTSFFLPMEIKCAVIDEGRWVYGAQPPSESVIDEGTPASSWLRASIRELRAGGGCRDAEPEALSKGKGALPRSPPQSDWHDADGENENLTHPFLVTGRCSNQLSYFPDAFPPEQEKSELRNFMEWNG